MIKLSGVDEMAQVFPLKQSQWGYYNKIQGTVKVSRTSDPCYKVMQCRYRFDYNFGSEMLRSEFGMIWYHRGMRSKKLRKIIWKSHKSTKCMNCY